MPAPTPVPVQAAKAAKPRPAVVGLVRLSTLAQSEEGRGGLARQYSVIRKTVQQKGLNLLRIFEVVDVSGTDVLRCPQIQELLELVGTRAVQGICIADLDRLFRPDKPSDYAILGVFQSTGAVIYSGDSELDLSTSNGMLFGQIRSAISGFELSLMKQRQQGAKEELRRAGKCPTPSITLPLGVTFDRAASKWAYTADIARVQHLFTLFDERGIHNYCELSRLTGIHQATIRVILKNPIYTGWRIINQRRGDKRVSRSGKTYRVKVPRAEDEVIRVQVFSDPAISQEVFDRVQLEMATTKFNHIQRFRLNMAINLGTGLLVCGHCGESLIATSGKKSQGHRGYYQCKANHSNYKSRLGGCKQAHLKLAEVEKGLLLLATQTLKNPAHLAELMLASLARQRSIIRPLPAPGGGQSLANDLQKRDRRLVEAYEAGAITVEELKVRRADIRAQIERLQTMEAGKAQGHHSSILQTARIIVKSALRFPQIVDPADQKVVLRKVFSQVLARDNQIISFRFNDTLLPDSSPLRGQSILLEPPITLFERPEQLPEGHRRCLKCALVQTTKHFHKRLNVCNTCRSKDARMAYLRRREKGRQSKAT